MCNTEDEDDDDDESGHCEACGERFQEGDLVFYALDGGFLHASCCGPEREGYHNDDGEPLGPNDPIPTPIPYTKDLSD